MHHLVSGINITIHLAAYSFFRFSLCHFHLLTYASPASLLYISYLPAGSQQVNSLQQMRKITHADKTLVRICTAILNCPATLIIYAKKRHYPCHKHKQSCTQLCLNTYPNHEHLHRTESLSQNHTIRKLSNTSSIIWLLLFRQTDFTVSVPIFLLFAYWCSFVLALWRFSLGF